MLQSVLPVCRKLGKAYYYYYLKFEYTVYTYKIAFYARLKLAHATELMLAQNICLIKNKTNLNTKTYLQFLISILTHTLWSVCYQINFYVVFKNDEIYLEPSCILIYHIIYAIYIDHITNILNLLDQCEMYSFKMHSCKKEQYSLKL